jgi:LPS export ABC transporter permease LptF
MKILSRYILKEFLGNLLLGLLIFTFVLMLDHLFELVDLLVNKGVGLMLTFELLFLLLPSSLSLTLPMSTLLAALLTYGRLSENNEITAVRASGLASWSYIKAPWGAALVAVLFLIPFNGTWAPHAHAKFRQLYVQVLQRNPLVRIEEKTFFEVGDYHLYVEKMNKRTRAMTGITIYKTPVEGAPLRIFAENGNASVNPATGMTFDLHDGRIEQIDPARPAQWFYTGFQNYVLTIPFQGASQTSTRALEEMDNHELRQEIRRLKSKGLPYPLFSCQEHLRWALAITPLLFVALGIPLAIRVQRGGRSIGFGISLIILMGYYVAIMGGSGVAQRGLWPPWLAVWMGNVIIACLGAWFNWRFVQQ